VGVFLDLVEFALDKFFPAGADRGIVPQAAEKRFHLPEREAHFTGEAEEAEPIDGIAGVAALTSYALGRRGKADFFVISYSGSVEICGGGEFTDFHSWGNPCQLERSCPDGNSRDAPHPGDHA
jgi:hypothetical protein